MISLQEISALSIPEPIINITETLEKAGFEAYIVGGCVRDLFLKRKPKDWDVTTNAKPEEIISLFPKTFYENTFGTVGVVNENLPVDAKGESDETLRVVEITPYRLEAAYTDNRRPDSVTFSTLLEDDLKRRDFTINAIALKVKRNGDSIEEDIVDLYKGQEDLGAGLIRTVGDAVERFSEDALRIIRAVRISSEIGFKVTHETEVGIQKTANLLSKIAKERIRDEFSRILMSDKPMDGILVLEKLGALKYILPELEEGIGCEQNKAHSFDVWTHLLKSLQHAADKGWSLEIRLAALLHDIGKPATQRRSPETGDWTFYGHEVVGARFAKRILEDLKYPRKTIDKVVKLVRWHMFFSDTEQITLSAVRRMIVNVGKENIWDLMNVRICDRIGTGRPKESPYRLRKYESMIEEAIRDPISVGMLKIDGKKIMEIIAEQPGPKVGFILHALLEEVLNDPTKNTVEYLENKAKEMAILPIGELKKLAEKGKEEKAALEEKEIAMIRKSHWVK